MICEDFRNEKLNENVRKIFAVLALTLSFSHLQTWKDPKNLREKKNEAFEFIYKKGKIVVHIKYRSEGINTRLYGKIL